MAGLDGLIGAEERIINSKPKINNNVVRPSLIYAFELPSILVPYLRPTTAHQGMELAINCAFLHTFEQFIRHASQSYFNKAKNCES